MIFWKGAIVVEIIMAAVIMDDAIMVAVITIETVSVTLHSERTPVRTRCSVFSLLESHPPPYLSGRRRLTVKLLPAFVLLMVLAGSSEGANNCPPTREDGLGPFYQPGAPVRSVLGTGYVLEGTVRSFVDCGIIAGARIEVWQAGPDGKYGDAYRATLISDAKGQYRLQTIRPPRYSSFRPPHIHVRVEVPGYITLITQHYPEKDGAEATFDLVLIPAE